MGVSLTELSRAHFFEGIICTFPHLWSFRYFGTHRPLFLTSVSSVCGSGELWESGWVKAAFKGCAVSQCLEKLRKGKPAEPFIKRSQELVTQRTSLWGPRLPRYTTTGQKVHLLIFRKCGDTWRRACGCDLNTQGRSVQEKAVLHNMGPKLGRALKGSTE